QWQSQGEGTTLRRCAVDADVASQQTCQIARNGQAQSRSTVLAMSTAIGLSEGIENDFLLVLGNSDPGVLNIEPHRVAGACRDTQCHVAGRGEFQRIGQEVPENLTEPLRISFNAHWRI